MQLTVRTGAVRPVGNVIEFNRWVDEEVPGASGKAKPANYPPDFLLPICFLLALVRRHKSSKYRKLLRYISPRIRIAIPGRTGALGICAIAARPRRFVLSSGVAPASRALPRPRSSAD
jgi:hypothetical protein